MSMIHGYLNADLEFDDYTGVSMNVWQADGDGVEVDTGHVIKVRPWAIPSGYKLEANQYVFATMMQGTNYDDEGYQQWWYVTGAERCAVPI